MSLRSVHRISGLESETDLQFSESPKSKVGRSEDKSRKSEGRRSNMWIASSFFLAMTGTMKSPPEVMLGILSSTDSRYLFSVSEAAPVLCRGGARYETTICDRHHTPLHPSSLHAFETRMGGERKGGGEGRGNRCGARNVRHPGTRPGQPAIESNAKHLRFSPGYPVRFSG